MTLKISAAWPSLAKLCPVGMVLAAVVAAAVPAPASATLIQSWNNYKWARTGPLALKTGMNVSAAWTPFVNLAVSQWNLDPVIDFVPEAGRSTAACGAVFGTVQVCSGSYGANGWYGYANVWLSGGFVVQATVRLNDSYLMSGGKYSTDAYRMMTACQELGHVLGLDHNNAIKTDLNKGSCMDYTNDPSGTVGGKNGSLANIAPSASDYAALLNNYATLDRSQLGNTKPVMLAGFGFMVDGSDIGFVRAVPEPGSWAMLIAGFGLTGAALRRRRVVRA